MTCGLLLILLISCFHLSSQQETRFVYDNFLRQENLYLDGSATVLPNGLLRLTDALDHEMAHVFYKESINLTSSKPLSFSTHFVCALLPQPGIEGGHGMAFVVSPSMDFSHAEATRYLGIFNVSKDGHPSSDVLAVELDTIWNPDFEDIDNNHVGIDVKSAVSLVSASASYYSDIKRSNQSINLLSGNPIQVWVDYDEANILNVSIAPLEIKKPSLPLLSLNINLSQVFQNRSKLFVGFSAATGTSTSYQYILWWSFSTNRGSLHQLDISRIPQVSRPKAQHKNLSPLVIILLGLLGIMVLCALVGMYYWRCKYSEVTEAWEKEYRAHRFSYKSLYKATKGFSKDEFLGKGGFGEVYRGTLLLSREIAVKRMLLVNDQGMQQFVTELVAMRCLKHKNLVPLLGYCKRKHEFLLVSEYMSNGSLDEHLFDDQKPILSWLQRLVIVKGIASALCYMHTIAERVVLHRDIKASNIMLDADFNGRLGDFGMARFHDHGSSANPTGAVGTLGYIAPELITTGASTATDVYAFGVFMLEVTCGRRPVEPQFQCEKRLLINWVCDCWIRDCLLDAIDSRLGDEFLTEEVEMVMKLGLLCTNTVPETRPTMEQVVLYLNNNLPMPDFSPNTVGFSTHYSVLIDAASLLASSVSSSLANHSAYNGSSLGIHNGT